VLSLVELQRAASLLDADLRGHRIQGITQPSPRAVVLSTYGGGSTERSGTKRHLLFSCSPDFARVSELDRPPAALKSPPAFSQFLRAHVMNAEIVGFRLLNGDRQLGMRLRAREGDFEILLAVLGRRSNVVLLDSGGRIVATVRPLAETRSELALGDEWVSPASTAPTAGDDRFADVVDDEFLRAVESIYTEAERHGEHHRKQRETERVLRKEARALDRKLEKMERSLADAEEAVGLEQQGELLKSVLSKVKRGDSRVVARDFASGEDVTIELDPTLSPSENLARLFKRFQKAVRGLTKTGARHAEVRAARDEISFLEETFTALADDEEMDAFSQRPDVERLLKKHDARRSAPRSRTGQAKTYKIGKFDVPGRLMPRRYRTDGGLEVWVGRSDQGNDLLSTRLARGKDLFFHLDGAPGSHVVLRTEGRSDPPSEAILDACELAIHYSKAKNATRADVHIVPIKNVKKPKGAKPGLVTVHGGKTVHMRRMRTRLDRILAARIEEE
jgi:predicted ribosome quality control (RQC) complex YloA/Tae2 family protein